MNQSTNATVGRLVKRLRAERGWSQAQLASKMGQTPVTVSALERGARNWTADYIVLAAEALSVAPATLLGDGVSVVEAAAAVNIVGLQRSLEDARAAERDLRLYKRAVPIAATLAMSTARDFWRRHGREPTTDELWQSVSVELRGLAPELRMDDELASGLRVGDIYERVSQVLVDILPPPSWSAGEEGGG